MISTYSIDHNNPMNTLFFTGVVCETAESSKQFGKNEISEDIPRISFRGSMASPKVTLESPLMALRRAQLSTLGATPLAEALATTRLAKVGVGRIEGEDKDEKLGIFKGKSKGETVGSGGLVEVHLLICTFLFC